MAFDKYHCSNSNLSETDANHVLEVLMYSKTMAYLKRGYTKYTIHQASAFPCLEHTRTNGSEEGNKWTMVPVTRDNP